MAKCGCRELLVGTWLQLPTCTGGKIFLPGAQAELSNPNKCLLRAGCSVHLPLAFLRGSVPWPAAQQAGDVCATQKGRYRL